MRKKEEEENAKSLDLVIMLKCRKDKHMDPLCLWKRCQEQTKQKTEKRI